ncbi:MAG: IPT/TIG domain-containing protein [Chitinophagaceae bacterium]|jgi:hypothetical protein|nr:IPT/TIG domain-containing protein [Chitinophagaceae bacterium]
MKKINNLYMAAAVLLCLSLMACRKNSSTDSTPTTQLTITNFSPTHGASGGTVTITGKGFSGNSSVSFNGNDPNAPNGVGNATLSAKVVTATATQLVVVVPVNAATGKISVTAGNLTATSTSDFTVD